MSATARFDLWPPSRTYPYFGKAAANPFRHEARRFERVNAAWLMDLSLLVYTQDRQFVLAELAKVGLDRDAVFIGFDLPFVSTQAIVVSNDRFVAVVFRGSEIRGEDRVLHIIADWLTNALALLVPVGPAAFAHAGFTLAVNHVWPDVLRGLGGADERAVFFAGHSLGAACATLAAYRYSNSGRPVKGVYTFGSPRIGDRGFGYGFLPKAFRVVHGQDVVTTVPGFGPVDWFIYRHVGRARHLAEDGSISADPAHPVTPFGSHDTGARASATGTLADAIRDHSPVLYAERLWAHLPP